MMVDEGFSQDEGDRCSICLGEKTDPVYLPCLHIYCRECIMTYIQIRETMTLEEELRRQLDNMEPIICPECRNTVFKKRNEELVLPRPTECSTCKRHIHKIVRFPCCGFQNDKTCLRCVLDEDTEIGTRVTCPDCETEISASALQALTLCVFCEELKIDPGPICECQGPVTSIDNEMLLSILAQLQDQLNTQHTDGNRNVHIRVAPDEQNLLERDVLLEIEVEENGEGGEETEGTEEVEGEEEDEIEEDVEEEIDEEWVAAAEEEKEAGSSLPQNLCTTMCIIALLLAGTMGPYLMKKIYYSDRGITCASDAVWIADGHGNIDPSICRRGTSRGTTNAKQSNHKETKTEHPSSQETPASTISKKNRVPIYQKECYPRAVWLITPEGEILTKTCEDVITGYKTTT